MSGIEGLLHGLSVAITPQALLFAFIGTLVGTLIGVLPGIGPALTIALLLPMTYGMEPELAFIMFAGIYYGAMYGGSTTSILLKTPGESGSVITAIDGNKMARQGRGAAALATAAIGSFVAGTIATVLLAFFAPWMVNVAVKLGAPDYFALMVVAFLSVSALVGSSPLRGMISMSLGLAVGLIGIDFQSGQQRLAFGQVALLDGIDTVVLIVALFAMGEVLYVAAHQVSSHYDLLALQKGAKWMSRQDWARSWRPWLRGTAVGFPLGVIPAGGRRYRLSSRMPWNDASPNTRRSSARGRSKAWQGRRRPTTPTPRAPWCRCWRSAYRPRPPPPSSWSRSSSTDSAGSAAAGEPGGPCLGADREPDHRQRHPAALNLPLVGLWVKILEIPKPYLFAGIMTFALLGTYAVNGSTFDVSCCSCSA